MRSVIFILIFIAGYIAFIWWCMNKLKNIARNPKKWDAIIGRKRYSNSSWYEPWYKRYGKHYYASLVVFIPCLLLIPGLYYVIGNLIQRYLLIPVHAQYLRSSGILIGLTSAVFFSIGIAQLVPFVVNRPIFVAARMYTAHSANSYAKAWRITILLLLILGILCLPIMAIGINACSYADEEKIVTHGNFSLAEKEIPYQTIVSGETSYSINKEHTGFTFRYTIELKDGTEFIISDYNKDGVIYIDSMLRQYGVPISRAEIGNLTYELMKQLCSDEKLELLEKCCLLTE